MEKDFYAVLGVAKSASADEIKKAYRKLARELHPDHNPGDKKSEARFKDVSEAYGVLSDERKRKEYDEMRALFGAGAFRRSARAGAGGPGGAGVPFDLSDLFGADAGASTGAGGDRRFGGAGFSDLFSSIFSGGGAGRRGAGRGRDVEAELTLSFAEAVQGATMPLTLRTPGVCETCQGSGAAKGSQPRTCAACHGTGLVTSNQGAFSFSEPCRECQGVGSIVEDKCPECRGTGGVTKTRTLNVRIPQGVSDGQRIRLSGRGEPGERGGPPGDLYVLIRVKRDDIFERKGDDLALTVPVTFAEAVFGTDLRVPTLDGTVTVRVPPGTPSGRTLRVRGKGVVTRSGRAGDLLVTVDVQVPKDLSEQARKALQEFADATPPAPRERLDAAIRRATGESGRSRP
nr:molecular chaperone DnaJ [Planosporangium flavigriseum]